MGDVHRQGEMTIPAGPFAAWLRAARAALRGEAGMDVPCGDCTGCCTSGYSIQLRPADTLALAAVPPHWLVESAGFAPGQQTLAPRSDGTCRMLEAGRCTIYAQRPQTCLDYDCRVFAAAGIDAGGADKAVINRRVREWRFDYPSGDDRRAHDAVRAAAAFIRRAGDGAAGIRLPTSPMGIAVLALKVSEVFLDPARATLDDAALGRELVAAAREFDRGAGA
jgi:hypothetical protein